MMLRSRIGTTCMLHTLWKIYLPIGSNNDGFLASLIQFPSQRGVRSFYHSTLIPSRYLLDLTDFLSFSIILKGKCWAWSMAVWLHQSISRSSQLDEPKQRRITYNLSLKQKAFSMVSLHIDTLRCEKTFSSRRKDSLLHLL